MKVITIFSTASAVLLSACASATPPSITADQVTAIGTKYERLSALPDTAIADLPPPERPSLMATLAEKSQAMQTAVCLAT